MIIQHVKDDWLWRFPQKVKCNRYRGASRPAYVFLCFLYYVIKDALILYFYFVFRFFKFVFWDVWNWIFKIDERQWFIHLKETLGIYGEDEVDDEDDYEDDIDEQEDGSKNMTDTYNVSCGDMPANRIANINDLWTCGNEHSWNKALEHYYELIPERNMALENELEAICPEEVERMTAGEFYAFLHDKYFVWKYTQKNRLATTRMHLEKYITQNRLHELGEIKNALFSADLDDVEQCLSIVTKIHGLGPAGASGLLAIIFPHYFGTVDQFVVKALSNVDNIEEQAAIARMRPESLTIANASVLMGVMRKQARCLNTDFKTEDWTPRKIDMILWSIGR